jgi:hypothetical protein
MDMETTCKIQFDKTIWPLYEKLSREKVQMLEHISDPVLE